MSTEEIKKDLENWESEKEMLEQENKNLQEEVEFLKGSKESLKSLIELYIEKENLILELKNTGYYDSDYDIVIKTKDGRVLESGRLRWTRDELSRNNFKNLKKEFIEKYIRYLSLIKSNKLYLVKLVGRGFDSNYILDNQDFSKLESIWDEWRSVDNKKGFKCKFYDYRKNKKMFLDSIVRMESSCLNSI